MSILPDFTHDIGQVAQLFASMRREVQSGGMPMTVRHLESILRQSEAHAKMHLRGYVTEDDINVAIRVTLNTFISSQKFSIAQKLTKVFAKFIAYKRDDDELLAYVLQTLVTEGLMVGANERAVGEIPSYVDVPIEEFEARARESRVSDVEGFYASARFKQGGYELRKEEAVIRKKI